MGTERALFEMLEEVTEYGLVVCTQTHAHAHSHVDEQTNTNKHALLVIIYFSGFLDPTY